MTQVSRYGHMLKVTVNGMRMRVTARYRVDGSVLNDTVQSRILGAETTLEIDSPDPPERVAKVVRQRRAWMLRLAGAPEPRAGHRSHAAERQPISVRGIGAPPPQRIERRQRAAVAGSGVECGPE